MAREGMNIVSGLTAGVGGLHDQWGHGRCARAGMRWHGEGLSQIGTVDAE